jgi:hypothetical protein
VTASIGSTRHSFRELDPRYERLLNRVARAITRFRVTFASDAPVGKAPSFLSNPLAERVGAATIDIDLAVEMGQTLEQPANAGG